MSLCAGDAIAVGTQSYSEQVFSWTSSGSGFWMLEWNSRLNSHV